MESITAIARACFDSFGQLTATLTKASAEHCESTPPDKIEQEFGRFKIWCANLGALQTGKSSLDSRLRESVVIRTNVLKHLARLDQTLVKSREVTSGARLPLEKQPQPEDSGSESSSEESESDAEPPRELALHLATIRDILNDLITLYREVDDDTGIDKFAAYTEFYRRHIQDSLLQLRRDAAKEMKKKPSDLARLRDTDQYLIDRLVVAMNKRRKVLRYWQRHARKMAEMPKEVKPVIEPQPMPKAPAANLETQSIIEKPSRQVQFLMPSSSVTGKTIFSKTEATAFDKRLDELLEVQSVISYVSTPDDVHGNDVELPAPPSAAAKGSEFWCPYCGIVCPARHGRPRAWRAHILQDLQPYICTYDECKDGYHLYSSRTTWLEHERLGHRRVWQCFEHAEPKFWSKATLRHHLESEHGGDITEMQIQNLIEISELSVEDTRTTCPFCLLDGPFSSGFENHMSVHMRRFATFSVSRDISTHDEAEDDTNENHSGRAQGVGSQDLGISGSLHFESQPPSNTASDVDKQALQSPPSAIWEEQSFSEDDQNSPPSYVRYPDLRHRLCHQTFRTSTYEQFKNANPNRVQGTSDPGCGKSVLAKSLVDYELRSTDEHTVCYFFFKDDNEQDNAANALCALLHQLFVRRPDLIWHAIPAWERFEDQLRKEVSELWRISLEVATSHELQGHYVTCVLDALDECLPSDQRWLIKKLAEFSTQISASASTTSGGILKFLVTSRPYSDIENGFLHVSRLRGEEANYRIDREVGEFIRTQVAKLAKGLRLHPHMKDLLETQMPLPSTVEDAYEKILKRGQLHGEMKGITKTILQIVVGARRALSVEEMAVILGVTLSTQLKMSLGEGQIDPLGLGDRIRHWCGLFVYVEKDRIYLIHPTAKEFLVGYGDSDGDSGWKYCLNPLEIEKIMTRLCVDLLSFEDVRSTAQSLINKLKLQDLTWENASESLLAYSAEMWSNHLRDSHISKSDPYLDTISDLYDVEGDLYNLWFPIYYALHENMATMQRRPQMTSFDLAALLGHEQILERMLQSNRYEINEFDNTRRTVLIWACEYGHENVVRILLEAGAPVNARLLDETALYAASKAGHGPVVQMLLEAGAEVNDRYTTALQAACYGGHTTVVRMLLDAGAEVNAHGGQFVTALHAAVYNGHEGVVQMLIDAGVDVNAVEAGVTALEWASSRGRANMVRMLIDAGADVTAVGAGGFTVLGVASSRGRANMVKMLKDAGANRNT
ncbi:hypothetical protein A1O3_09344 [Capronia epimyces CBS 606.96]|uniref:Uncharacterized protein n=1 Tax=Capronia epimyces CBS 606.96 TaxID=1182542 RepID=W9XD91_9EURO|nr:uncharacterized protein A1O3_09344 [Capronia epimyces CBS 606.96]EXJ78183.1 hypothetical protein A1O3_09344 [Capronia epimyces CBS 606.96]